MTQYPATIGDFSILPIAIPPLPAYPTPAIHHVYVRRNAPKVPTVNDRRSLFLTNVPVDSTEAHFRAIFVKLLGAGRVEGVTFEDERNAATATAASEKQPAQAVRLAAHTKKRKREDEEKERAEREAAAVLPVTWSRQPRRSGSTAVVLLVDENSVELSLKAIAKLYKSKKYPVWGEGVMSQVPSLGSEWLRTHDRLSYPDKEKVQAAVDAFFTTFNRKEQEAIELAKRLRNEPDEDGFVTVTRGGRSAPARRDEAEEARRKMLDKQDKKKTELSNFYRFQLRERKKAEQTELLRRFSEDRRKVDAMKERRGKFRPEA